MHSNTEVVSVFSDGSRANRKRIIDHLTKNLTNLNISLAYDGLFRHEFAEVSEAMGLTALCSLISAFVLDYVFMAEQIGHI